MPITYPVSGSQVEILHNGAIISYGQGMKMNMQVDYQTVRQLGSIYPATFVITFVTITGGFTVADSSGADWQGIIASQIEESRLSSNPDQWGQFTLRAISGNQDAPTYTITNVRFMSLSPTVDITGGLLENTITFIGIRLETV